MTKRDSNHMGLVISTVIGPQAVISEATDALLPIK